MPIHQQVSWLRGRSLASQPENCSFCTLKYFLNSKACWFIVDTSGKHFHVWTENAKHVRKDYSRNQIPKLCAQTSLSLPLLVVTSREINACSVLASHVSSCGFRPVWSAELKGRRNGKRRCFHVTSLPRCWSKWSLDHLTYEVICLGVVSPLWISACKKGIPNVFC